MVLEHRSPVSLPLLRRSPPPRLPPWISFLLLPSLIPTNLAALTTQICHFRFWFGSQQTKIQVAAESESLRKDRHLLIQVLVDSNSCPHLLPLSPSLISLQPPQCFSNTPSEFQPQGLCLCFSSREKSASRHLHGLLSLSTQLSAWALTISQYHLSLSFVASKLFFIVIKYS